MESKKIANNITELIGNTPIVKINNLSPNPNVNIYAKLEYFNPSGSIKDRIAFKMIEHAEKTGKLTKQKTIIEPTSGNTGIALAMIGKIKGYKVTIAMSSAVSIERQQIIKAYGAEIILTDKNSGTDGAIKKVHEIVKKNPEKFYFPNQFSNKCNYLAHYESTAQEIYEQMNGKIDYFVSSLGTSGTIMGIGMGLKEKDQNIQIVSAHPEKGHYIQGLKNMEEAIIPAIYDENKIDETIIINSEKAFEMTRQIAKKEGIFVGMSSGAAMIAATQIAKKIKKGNIIVIFPDRGEKYLSTNLFK